MSETVKFYAKPKLNMPVMVAAWPGIGNVAILVATYLEKNLDFQLLGEVDAPYFFEPIGVTVRDNVVEAPQFPQGKFYYLKRETQASDIILFIGDEQPINKTYEMANTVANVATTFHVRRIYTCAAAVTRIHHTEQPGVWGVATTRQLAEELKDQDLVQKGDLQISGLNGLLLGVAKERGVEGVCLLGEVPTYATQIQNPMAALAIMGVLTKLLGVDVDTSELAELASETKEGMKQLAAEAMGEYIDHFTEPKWERGEEGDEEGEDEEEEE